VRSEGFYLKKDPLTPAGIEPATFRIVAQHLNHCATAVSHPKGSRKQILEEGPDRLSRNVGTKLPLLAA